MIDLLRNLKLKIKSSRINSHSKANELFHLLPYGLTLLDIGASGGMEPRWHRVNRSINYIGIEPDSRNNKDLEYINSCKEVQILDAFAWSKKETINFNLCKKGGVSSFFFPNSELLCQYKDFERFDIVAQESIVAEPLSHKLRHKKVDFVKLDIQGSELSALQGLNDNLIDCLGMEIEVEFSEMYLNQPLFGEISNFMKRNGFYFSDFTNLCRWERDNYSGFGRCMFGDGLWLKEPKLIDMNNLEIIMKYSAICLLYGKLDEAANIIDQSQCQLPPHFSRTVFKQIALKRNERALFRLLKNIWSLFSPATRLHLLD